MIRASAPGRCGLVGNPTDIYGGTVISSSLEQRAEAVISPAEGIHLDICGCREEIRGLEDLQLANQYTDVAKSVMTRFPETLERGNFRLVATTTIPMKAGLAGSTAMICAILGAVLRMLEIELNPCRTAEMLRDIEFNVMKCVCGYQDQYMAVRGGINIMDFYDKDPRNDLAGEVYATVESLEPLVRQIPLVLANTGVEHHSGHYHQGLRERWLERDADVIQAYEQIARLARLGKVAILDRDWERLGRLMDENHAIQQSLAGTGEANERLIRAAREAGAFGAKLAGAGQGGTIVAIHSDPDALAAAMEAAGSARVLRVTPSPGLTVEGRL